MSVSMLPNVDGREVDDFFDRLGDATDLRGGGHFATAIEDAADVYFEAMRERFDQFSLRGGDWAEHAPSTIRKRGPGAPILYEDGDLRRSLDRTGENHVIEVESDVFREGTEDPKARFHQDGTDKMPAREILVPPDEQTVEQMKQVASLGLQWTANEVARGG